MQPKPVVGKSTMVSIRQAVEISIPNTKGAHTYLPIEQVGGHQFFHLAKKDRRIQRMLLGDSDTAAMSDISRPLANTSIVEKITDLRDKAFREKMGIDEVGQGASKVVRYSRSKCLMGKMLQLDDYVTISLPTVGDLSPIDAKVLLSKPKSPLMIEMSEAVVDYLRSFVSNEVSTGDTKRKHPRDMIPEGERVTSDQVGVSYSYTRKQFRASQGGITRFFKPKDNDLGEAELLAVESIKVGLKVASDSELTDIGDGSTTPESSTKDDDSQ